MIHNQTTEDRVGLKEWLLTGEWWQTVVQGPNPTSFTTDQTPIAREAATRIAKLEEALHDLRAAVLGEWEGEPCEPMDRAASLLQQDQPS